MKLDDKRYGEYALVQEMLETVEVIRSFPVEKVEAFARKIAPSREESAGSGGRTDSIPGGISSGSIGTGTGSVSGITRSILLTGEGSSRIFPAKRCMASRRRRGSRMIPFTEGATQALEYDLDGTDVFIASNSGRTKEGVRLLRALKERREVGGREKNGKNPECYGIVPGCYGIVANADSPIMNESDGGYALSCGAENAVAATKSVMEQALFYDVLFRLLNGESLPDFSSLADMTGQVLAGQPPAEMVRALVSARFIFWAGRNDGVAEELTLKTNEIVRKNADFLEGTYAVHGIEEVMDPTDTVVLIEPFPEEEEKFRQVLVDGVGLTVTAIATRQTSFPTFLVPSAGELTEYLLLAAGWNVLVEAGIGLGINLDKPVRARKVGNAL